MRSANEAACRWPRHCAVDRAIGVQNLAQDGSPHLSNLDRILARKTPELQDDTAGTAAFGRSHQCGYKSNVARICGDVSTMQAREGRKPQIRHIRKRRRPTGCKEARETPHLMPQGGDYRLQDARPDTCLPVLPICEKMQAEGREPLSTT
ncbi:hypothetical protein P171DRAFT_267809 [Karstenula rhodostoma CBS 690.94]|uniref:Uncharacterized protein n=1 Tax=Karstenula rhodostoma CBS 690.94 TaxID=1392251 RepID=A0A9P4UCW0_9PLEO|nr:hypothetical protein P171DRAFT_267809 [Karstenula rhodostoma CBS 690.94]